MSVSFQYPYTSPTLTLTMRNPDLGDSRQDDLYLSYGRSMNAVMYTYKYTPPAIKLLLIFRHLTKIKVDELISFLHQTSGKEIKYTDHNSIVWRGSISTDPNDIATYGTIPTAGGSSDACVEVSEITLEFEGVEA